MKKGNRNVVETGRTLRVIVAFLVLGASAWVTMTASPNLGLDLEGGAQITLEAEDGPEAEANAENTDRALEVLRRRVDALGVSEPSLTRSGENRIIVELPGVEDPTEAAETLGQTAQLTFHSVLGYASQEELQNGGADSGADDSNSENSSSDDTSANDEDADTEEANASDDEGAGDEATGDEESGGSAGAADEFDPSAEESVIADERGQPLLLDSFGMTGEEVSSATAQFDAEQYQGWVVHVDFTGDGSSEWADLTGHAACFNETDPQRRVAIVLDGDVISSPTVQDAACDVGQQGGTTRIIGDFDQESAEELAALIEGGALPLPVEIIEQRVVGPTLGEAAISASAWAAIIGISLTAVFVVVTYRLIGLMAVGALVGYAAMAFAALTAVGATLTLPGLAGFVLAIGMAVDANVLIFERAREDYVDGGTSLRNALPSGFKKAISAIADANVTTLIAATLLFFLAAGPVQGFGVTLTIGVVASLLAALVLTRALGEWLISRPWVRRNPGVSGLAKHTRVRRWLRERSPDLMRRSRQFLAVSLIAVAVAGAGIAMRGLNFGIEFTGGRIVEVQPEEQVDIEDARDVVTEVGFPTAIVNESGGAGEDAISVRAADMGDTEAQEIIGAISELGNGGDLIRDEMIGPSLGEELQRNGLIALAVALAAQLSYLAIRFRWTFSTGAVIALFQNVIITIGVFAWLGKPIDGIFLAAILTIIGYTVNDSVVVFDRIREAWRGRRGENFGGIANTAVLDTLPRSVNTGLSTLFPLIALFALGGDSLSDFAFALIIGILIGTYSSNFTATPLAVELESRYPAPEPKEKDEVTKGNREDPNYGAVV
ncbi:protein translocase subunit SecD [Actinobacteria bacterium YIM 96077]|uniref:Multifunctional fusion protein n=2 Tax=Phytoactinopolyspora halophila TaxID=1981511 RepID=A0A329R0R3_9ACTN|nr:protein translocase subunit SecD [Actinobacteria bacterium YIM 96077]RAW18185.1 protein translocase subunit SecD [Phytoactinopolyspora halophila]